MEKTKCEITGLDQEKDKWVFISEDKTYSLSISVINKNIYLIKPKGIGKIKTHLESFPVLESVYKSIDESNKAYIIHDYSELASTDMAARRHYTRWVLKNFHKTHFVIFCNVNRSITIMVKTGKFISKVFEKVYLKKNLEDSLNFCLLHAVENQVDIPDKTSLKKFNELWKETAEYFSYTNGQLKIIRKNDWKLVVKDDFMAEYSVIDKNIITVKFKGIYRKGYSKIVGEKLLDVKSEVCEENEKIYALYDVESLVKLPLPARSEVTRWHLDHMDIFNAVIFSSLNASQRANVTFAKRLYSKLKDRIYTVPDIESALLLAIDLKNGRKEGRKAYPKIKKISKEELIRENIELKGKLSGLIDNQNRKIQDLISSLGRVTWDEAFKQVNFKIDDENDSFADLYETANMVIGDIQEIIDEKEHNIKRAHAAEKLKSAFLANMSHEIRTPINSILGFSELLLERDDLDDKAKYYLKIITSNSDQLLKLINDILDLSKIESEMLKLKYESHCLNHLLEEIALSASSYLEKRKGEIEIKTEFALQNGESVMIIDRTRLRQIVENLVNNAMKFTEKGIITIGYEVSENQMTIWVKDTGIGISAENQRIIFDRFTQVNNTMSNIYRGTGLGLAISKHLAEMMKWKIRVVSESGKGSAFYLTLPYRVSKADLEQLSENESVVISDLIRNKGILVVEDNHDNFELIHNYLYPDQNRIYRAITGRDAIELCRAYNIDLILMDINIPEMDGFETTKLIKQEFPMIPVIAQSANVLEEDITKAFNAGCDNYITKPIKREALLRMISMVLK